MILKILLIVWAVSFLIVSVEVSGDIRSDIAALKNESDVLKDKIGTYGANIVTQKQDIKEKEKLYEIAKANEKKERSEIGDSWASFQEHDDSVQNLITAENQLRESKLRLQVYIDARNEALKRIKVVEEEIIILDKIPPPDKPPGKLYGISLDKTCLTKIRNNVSGVCPTYEEIGLFFPGISCKYKGVQCLDHYKQTGSGKGYILNPDLEIRERIDIIEIRAEFSEFTLKGVGGYDNANHTLVYNLGRYVDRCDTVYIDASQWLVLLGDSIMYLDSGCTKTYHTQERFEYLNQTIHDISTSYKWQLDQWIKESKEKCREKCFEY